MSNLPTAPPSPTPDTQPFWDATKNDVLLLPKCDACGEIHWYPRGFCPFCHKGTISWIEASGDATLYTYSVSERGRADWAEVTPYVVAYVELAEGPRILTNVVDCDPAALEVGQNLTVVFDEAGEYKFPGSVRPDPEASTRMLSENLATLWETAADTLGDRLAVAHGETRRSWAELEARAARLAGGLAGLGVGQGSLVAIDLWNCPENVEAIFASFKLRAVPFNINYRFRETELVHMFTDSNAVVAVFDVTLADRVLAAAERLDHAIRLVQVGGETGAALPPGVIDFEQLIAESEPAPRIERDGEDELIIYTGGTTGYPKGVVWAHNQFGQQMLGTAEIETLEDYAAHIAQEERTALVISPLMHMTGFAVTIGTLNGGGGAVFCTSRSLDADEILRLVEEFRIKMVMMIGDAFAKPILDALEKARAAGWPYDLSSVESIGNVGLMMSAPVKKGLLEHGDFTIRDGIGATEGGQFATTESKAGDEIETAKFKLGPNARVIAEDGKDVVPGSGQIGFLASAGRLPKGYLNDPERSAKTWPTIDGVRYSMPGDMATVEADGTITLLGRGSEVINTGGEKVFVEEVEQAIITHPAVREVLVVGVPDERFGTRVAAVVALEPGSELSYAEIREHVGRQLSDHKRPRQVVFVDAVPRGPSGKNDRKRAKEIAAEAAPKMTTAGTS